MNIIYAVKDLNRDIHIVKLGSMGIEMVRQGAKPDTSVDSSKNMGIVPFATPLLAGPGAISLVIILMKGDLFTKILTIVSVLLVLVIVYFFFIYSSKIFLLH